MPLRFVWVLVAASVDFCGRAQVPGLPVTRHNLITVIPLFFCRFTGHLVQSNDYNISRRGETVSPIDRLFNLLAKFGRSRYGEDAVCHGKIVDMSNFTRLDPFFLILSIWLTSHYSVLVTIWKQLLIPAALPFELAKCGRGH
jgi:hypothetical protein